MIKAKEYGPEMCWTKGAQLLKQDKYIIMLSKYSGLVLFYISFQDSSVTSASVGLGRVEALSLNPGRKNACPILQITWAGDTS